MMKSCNRRKILPLFALVLAAALLRPCAAAPQPGAEDPHPALKKPDAIEPARPKEAVEPAERDDVDAAYDYIQLLTEAMLQVKKRYVKEKTYKEIVYGAMHGLLEGLDAHSSFLEKDEYTAMQDDTAGKFGGVGLQLGVKNGLLMIIAPIEDTPGFRAGLQAGDYILEIDGQKTQQMTMGGI